ncbi:ATP-dependent bile acid permease [Coprinopsis marcescibilis]|uniref:ATP-dependent bile acid permease n=1 Tax=Coprinopsis marcescibilis TaxID=230819 RepID=A0A5C3KTD3_COPMA|nr:ATP-dependent bile acid permease [Coprinopsis marcescibilis]
MRIPNPFHPSPSPPGFGGGKVVPEKTSNVFSRAIFHWLTPFLEAGFSRPLEKDDFWLLPPEESSSVMAEKIEANYYARVPPEKRPRHLRDIPKEQSLGADDDSSAFTEKADPEAAKPSGKTAEKSKKAPKKYDESLFKAIAHTFSSDLWVSGILKLIADVLKTTTPLLTRVLLQWLGESYRFHRLSEAEQNAAVESGLLQKPRGIGYGIGLAFAFFAMQQVASLLTNWSMQLTMAAGLHVRSGLIGVIFRKALRISGRGRIDHNSGQITTMISTDTTKLDRFTMFAHVLWIAPIQLAIGIGLVIGTLGYSALVGLGVLVVGLPLQIVLVKIMFAQREKGVKFTDKRLRLTGEVMQGIRLVKFFAWENFYMEQILGLRSGEITALKKTAIARSGMIAMMTFIPILAAILSFITYALTDHNLDVAIIFTALQLFNIIRMPLMFFPFVLAAFSEALVAVRRIGAFLTAEDLPKPYDISERLDIALEADGDFAWETVNPPDHATSSKDKKAKKKADKKNGKQGSELPQYGNEKDVDNKSETTEGEKDEEKPFELNDFKLRAPKGAFIGIVGRVGSGKSSALQALIGEMRKIRGDVKFGGSMAYAPQAAWIRNATLRDNILFGQPYDEERFRGVIDACNLEHDIEMLPNGLETEIGEKGINLSGGQKARVSLARVAYSSADIALLDDPLSAVDAYVGKAILDNCFLNGPLADRTRILVTHSLHVLDKLDYIYVMDQGRIIEQGTYVDLMANSTVFSRLVEDYGNAESDGEDEAGDADKHTRRDVAKKDGLEAPSEAEAKVGKKSNAALIQEEERNMGAITGSIYSSYLKAAGGVSWGPWLLILLTLTQAASVGNTLFLGFWTAQTIPGFSQGHYMGVYAGLGGVQAVFTFVLSFCYTLAALRASYTLGKRALQGVLRAPVSFFDTTPMGRVLSRFSKDQDTLDTDMSMISFQFSNTLFHIFGTIGLVFYIFPYLGIIFAPMVVIYQVISLYYRRTSVEAKRWDSLHRSILYSSFSESLTGLSTIRAYREEGRSIKEAEAGLDYQNRAYYMIVSLQRWLAVRLDLLGNILILGIALFAAGFRTTINPSQTGVLLSYTLTMTQFFSEMVAQYAQIEQNMNSVERVLHYADISPEGDLHTPNDPPASWPQEGTIEFKKVDLAYREGLPRVLKEVDFKIRPGEKVGIVGRTGAGKSSLLQALFRMVEVSGGKIEIDGVNIRDVGLQTLRTQLALVPQDSVLFLGTLRDNLDPQRTRTDAELIQVLQRAWLLPAEGPVDPSTEAKFSLDSVVGDDGSNFSAGEKQLLALARALVKNSRVIVLDEATSSVDVETDSKLQRTIQTQFTTSTLLCIAHRLNTIAYYDRVIVMDQGQVAEFDTVLNLYDNEDSIFRSLCDEANLQRADILRIRSENAVLIS